MKRIIKISAFILAIIVMCLSFSGCAQLDEMKDTHAVWTEKGNANSITYNGTEYKFINCPDEHDLTYKMSEKVIMVTDPDVPVLLSTEYGESLYITKDENFIYGLILGTYAESIKSNNKTIYNKSEYSYEATEGKEVLYCKEDIYDDITASIESGIKYTDYGYSYWDYNNEKEPYQYVYLDDKDAKLIDKIIHKTKAVEKKSDTISHNSISICVLDHISDDRFFCKESYEVFWLDTGEYYLSQYSPNRESYINYKVEKKYYSEFDRIFKYAKSATEYEDVYV